MSPSHDVEKEVRQLRVFLSHTSGDKPAVRHLSAQLQESDIDVWLDEEKLLPGQDWKTEITIAVQRSDAVVIVLSQNSITKEGYFHREIRLALEVAEEKPDGTIFIIPARIDSSPVPRQLSRWQWVDLAPNNTDGLTRLLEALAERARGIDSVTVPNASLVVPRQKKQVDVKYFYYASVPKLQMIGTQLGLAPSGLSVKELTDSTNEITAALEKKGSIKRLVTGQKLQTGQFYISTNSWRQGLFYFSAGRRGRNNLVTGVMYVLWTMQDDSILLLTGSPEHILGEKVVREGLFVPGTSGAVEEVFRIAKHLSVDEPALLTGDNIGPSPFHYGDVPGYEIHEGTSNSSEDEVSRRFSLPYGWRDESNALSLALFCFHHLSSLPATRIETVFRLFSSESAVGPSLREEATAVREKWLAYNFISKDPDRLAEEQAAWERIDKTLDGFPLDQCKHVHIGSPLYTALI
ncbi:MAG: toll/interleukin-1 receptor domain-containing protein [Candidatus Thiodiazotropha sp.]